MKRRVAVCRGRAAAGLARVTACALLAAAGLGGLGGCGGGGGGDGGRADGRFPDPESLMLPADQVDQTTGGGGAGGATGANATATSAATRTTYALDGSGAWQSASAPAAGSDEAVLARARELLATDRPGAAHKVIDEWLRPRERTDHPLLPQAYLLRADATAADGNEYEALYDYEALIKNFPGAPEYVIALERELDIGVKYLNGVERKFLGVRWVDAAGVGEELLIRIHERLPGSRLAERAGIELADYYYRTRDLPNAAVAYELFLQNHPRSAYTMRARQRQIFSNLGRFKGPRYDSTKLLDSKVLIDRFQRDYPAQAEQLGLDEALAVRIDESSAEQMLDAANWHMARQDIAAARLIMNRLVRRHPQTATAQRVLAELQSRGWLMDEQAAATNTPTGQEAKP